MLVNIDRKEVTTLPYREDYRRWTKNLTQEDILKIKEFIREKISEKEVSVSSWLGSFDWSGTPLEKIKEGKDLNYNQSAMLFGLFCMEIFIEHEDLWCFTKNEDIRGIVYFRIES